MASKIDRNYHSFRVPGILVVAICLFGFPSSALASNNCPWINEATVSGLLEGNAVGAFSQGSANQPATCTFVSETTGGSRTLFIRMETTPDAAMRLSSMAIACGQLREAVPAIGNEAFICPTEHSREAVILRLIGRVRHQVFSITITISVKEESVVWMADLRTRIAIAAEQVSGNLF